MTDSEVFMENGNKGNLFAAVAGAVVGAGAVLASVIAIKDKGTKENIKKVANKAIKTAEKVTKSAKKEVKKYDRIS